MATYISDVDGTLVRWGTNDPLPNAVETLRSLFERGHQIVFTTQRDGPEDPRFDHEGLMDVLRLIDPTPTLLYRLTSPRYVINDAGAHAIEHESNTAWNYTDL